jgi:hypothetical protein
LSSSKGPEVKLDVNNPMLDAKCNRKRAEVDLQLLANRIALMKAEEARALAKISVTKDRAEQISDIKKRNESSGTERASIDMIREENLRTARIRAQTAQQNRKARLAETRQLVSDTKAAVATQKRAELERLMQERQHQLLVEEVERRQKAEEQRRRHELIKIRSAQLKEEKEKNIQAEYNSKLREEIKRAEEAEALIVQLEQEEKAMIERLRSVHETQQAAYQVLKQALD